LAVVVRLLVHDGTIEGQRCLAEWTLPQGRPEGNVIKKGEMVVVEILENRRSRPR
jgi:hypothetical protein